MIQVERVEAVQFNRVMTAGRTSPLLLTCERSNGSTTEAVVKFASGHECTKSSLCAELIAAQLAVDLGLPTPTPIIVTWGQAFGDSIAEARARQIVVGSAPPAFGSTFITGGFATWPADRTLIGEDVRQAALAAFFFDGMIGNGDRRGKNPNLLVRGDSFRLIDHELAFRDYLLFVQPKPPWALGGFNDLVRPDAHIFAAPLIKGVKELDFGPIRAVWAALSDRQIEDYVTTLPPEWALDDRLTTFAVARIKECRDRINDCVTECRRALYDRT